MTGLSAIHTVSLTKYYGKARGIINLNLTVEESECFGFIGPNGAGKSTTIRTLLGLISPSSGSATVLGKDIVKEKEAILRDVGYLPSDAVFYPGMRVKDVLKLSASLRKKDCAQEAAVLCERLQLDPSRKVDELSFGNRKKVAIVCALQSNPRLLVLDEPTGGLDPLMQHAFFEIIREKHRAGATVLFSSHILSEVERKCNHAVIIREGEIIACDTVDNLAKTNARRVSFRGSANFEGLPGIRDLRQSDRSFSFLYSGSTNLLLRRLADGDVHDLSISEPDLEEVFLHYYGKGSDRS